MSRKKISLVGQHVTKENVKKGLNNACNELEGLYLCIDVLTDKESKKDKEYWKEKVMEDV